MKTVSYQPCRLKEAAEFLQQTFGGSVNGNIWEKEDVGSFRFFEFDKLEISKASMFIDEDVRLEREHKENMEYYPIYFSLDGKGLWQEAEEQRAISEGGAVFLSNQPCFVEYQKGTWVNHINLRIHRDLLLEILGPGHPISFKIEHGQPVTIYKALSDEINVVLQDLFSEWGNSLGPYHAKARAYELFVMIVKLLNMEESIEAKKDSENTVHLSADKMEVVMKARDLLVQNYLNPPSQVELSRHCGVSETLLRKMFKQVFNISMYQYVKDYRLNLAKEMLEKTNWPINVVGNRIGYVHMGQFSAAMKKKFGFGPKEIKAGMAV
ncbi:AraC family transcriptional regulator [Persicobacter diffluens]|uniref:HTH araC/xylS-type domain-containing protein n=1 Tax=Persicobacter diffluens TaxID=981 RepID=A0AAN4W1S7_9BACT|nr:hypothetical protein PEDI_35850 [Persicobacter diffluens]